MALDRDFIRVDFLVDANQIDVNELTIYHTIGLFQDAGFALRQAGDGDA